MVFFATNEKWNWKQKRLTKAIGEHISPTLYLCKIFTKKNREKTMKAHFAQKALFWVKVYQWNR